MNTYSDTELDAAEAIIGALDSRLRVQIIWRLSMREHFVHELVNGLGKSQPLISQHLRVLKRSGIVDSERRGREVIYRLVLPQAADIVTAAVGLGLRANNLQQSEVPRSEAGADVIHIGTRGEARGAGTTEDPVGQAAHTPAVAHTPAAAAMGDTTGADSIPDPSPTPPVPSVFR